MFKQRNSNQRSNFHPHHQRHCSSPQKHYSHNSNPTNINVTTGANQIPYQNNHSTANFHAVASSNTSSQHVYHSVFNSQINQFIARGQPPPPPRTNNYIRFFNYFSHSVLQSNYSTRTDHYTFLEKFNDHRNFRNNPDS